MRTISCIIPAYNEASRIGSVLSVVTPLLGTAIQEIIVVDDGSTDGTGDVVKKFSGVEFISHPVNRGKNNAIISGIKAAKNDFLLFVDADMYDLTPQNILDLTEPVREGKVDCTIAIFKNSAKFSQFIGFGIDYLSGQRVLPKSLLLKNIDAIAPLPSLGLEVFINRLLVQNKCKIKIISWRNVSNTTNPQKAGSLLKGIRKEAKMWRDVLATFYPWQIIYHNFLLRQLWKNN
jgi:hypothetical protein